jgi:ubiquinone/menaquinone biosynthesis C-methylase UbiE
MAANFDSLARPYRWMERLSFGGALARARVAHVDTLSSCRQVLLLGDGDGRFLARALAVAPSAEFHSIDASATMLALACARLSPADRARVTVEHADALEAPLAAARYDAVVTLFFLDCFTPAETTRLVERVARAATPNAIWLFADFAIPARGIRRAAARVLTGGLYWFFRWRTGISATHLPDAEHEIARHGFAPAAVRAFAFGLLRSVRFVRVDARLDGARRAPAEIR